MTNLANSIARFNRCSLNDATPIKILSPFVPNTLLATVHVWRSQTPKGIVLYLTHSPLCIFALFWLINCKIRVHILIKSCKQGRLCQLYNVLVYCFNKSPSTFNHVMWRAANAMPVCHSQHAHSCTGTARAIGAKRSYSCITSIQML